METNEIKNLLKLMGFQPIPQGNAELEDTWEKSYPQHACGIRVNFALKKIDYPTSQGMIVGDLSTSNFSRSENFVVLECVNRLLDKGYPPKKIELEKAWQLGRKASGKLDILVKQKNNHNAYLMIECKTHSEQYGREAERMLKNGGQLFTYWQQDKTTEILCLYSSSVSNGEIDFKNSIVQINNGLRETSNVEEAFRRWNKQFASKGIFEDDISAYLAGSKPLLKQDLRELKKDDGDRIYHQFLEILRHHIVSDKGNAFNKIFNLFLCKIIDEDRANEEQLDFQWLEGTDNEEALLGRLNGLYKQGMHKYLDKDVTDYSPDDIENLDDHNEIRQVINQLRLYRNQEFAFVDVFNRESFLENSKIVIELVKLLQGWQVRYTSKQQFLGEFFELLLNTGFKQESGQFFTPIPLVRFILKSLPIDSIIKEKIKNRENNFLPYVIDFACGSGHFLTETMDVLWKSISQINDQNLSPSHARKYRGYRADQFGWAKEYIYGIERDYRLAKAAKLASFLYGDGEARIFHASGIAPFSSASYSNRLSTQSQTNEKFDILVANPPYAVKGFRSAVEDGCNSFRLFEKLSSKSDNIEVLFIERMSQLVCPNGVVGIILPRSILNGTGIYEDARKIIFENFELKAIVILGSNAFMATSINTAIFFLVKRRRKIKLENYDDYKAQMQAKIVVIKSGSGEQEKQFLGYEFRSRKGSEGLRPREKTLLLDENNIYSTKHANSYILRSMENDLPASIDPSLKDYIRILELERLFDWDSEPFSNGLFFIDRFTLLHSDMSKIVPLKSVIQVIESGKRPKGGISEITEGAVSLGGEHIESQTGEIKLENKKFVPAQFYNDMAKGRVESGDILVCKDGAQTGKCAFFDLDLNEEQYCVNEHVFRIVANPKVCSQKFLFYFMMSSFFWQQVKVYAYNKKAQPGLNYQHIEKIKILCLPLQEQKQIVAQIEKSWSNLSGKDERVKFVNKVFSDKGLSYENGEGLVL